MAGTSAQLSQAQNRQRNPRRAPIRQRRRGGVERGTATQSGDGPKSRGYSGAESNCLFSVRFSVELWQKQRAFGELTPPGCLSAGQRVEAGGRSWSTQLSDKQFR